MNPFGFAYSSTVGVVDFAQPGRVIVTGRGNRYNQAFQEARKLGVELWMYSDVLEVPDNLSNPQDAEYYLLADGSRPPLWPGRDANGNPRRNWYSAKLLDITPGSAWLLHIIPKHIEWMQRHLFDGFMLDTLGARPWSRTKTVDGELRVGADWDTWPVDEQTQYATCCVNIAREIAAAVAPMMKLVHNNNWLLAKDHPAYATALAGEKYCNGVMIENAAGNVPPEFHKALAGRAYGLLPRRVPVVDTTDAEVVAWSKVPGVTHVCSVEKTQGETYARITPRVDVAYTGVPVEEVADENLVLRERVAELTAENTTLHVQATELREDLLAAEAEVAQLTAKIGRIDAEVHA